MKEKNDLLMKEVNNNPDTFASKKKLPALATQTLYFFIFFRNQHIIIFIRQEVKEISKKKFKIRLEFFT